MTTETIAKSSSSSTTRKKKKKSPILPSSSSAGDAIAPGTGHPPSSSFSDGNGNGNGNGNGVTESRRASQYILWGGWRCEDSAGSTVRKTTVGDLPKYRPGSLIHGMIECEETRRSYLERNGRKQITYTKSSDGWLWTLCVWEGRALGRIWFPWTICTLNAIVWTCHEELVWKKGQVDGREREVNESWDFFFGMVINTSLAFLLVFRLNRAAERFWIARENWGVIVGVSRYLVSTILTHGRHNPAARDEAIRWVVAFGIATMQFIRSIRRIPSDMLAGVLDEDRIGRLERAPHPPLYAADETRNALAELFGVTPDMSPSLAHARTQHLVECQSHLNHMMNQEGAMERIKSTPLPVVYVSHLRTFLVLFLVALPYVWEPAWGWLTIPVVSLSSFALLGLDGASEESEAPFRQDRPNHLNMDAFCLLMQTNIQQSCQHEADRDLMEEEEKEEKEEKPSAHKQCKDKQDHDHEHKAGPRGC